MDIIIIFELVLQSWTIAIPALRKLLGNFNPLFTLNILYTSKLHCRGLRGHAALVLGDA